MLQVGDLQLKLVDLLLKVGAEVVVVRGGGDAFRLPSSTVAMWGTKV